MNNINSFHKDVNQALEQISQIQVEGETVKTEVYTQGYKVYLQNPDSYRVSKLYANVSSNWSGWAKGLQPLADLSSRIKDNILDQAIGIQWKDPEHDDNLLWTDWTDQKNPYMSLSSLQAASDKVQTIYDAVHANQNLNDDALVKSIDEIHSNINLVLNFINNRKVHFEDDKMSYERQQYLTEIEKLLSINQETLATDETIQDLIIDESYEQTQPLVIFRYPKDVLAENPAIAQTKLSQAFEKDLNRGTFIAINNQLIYSNFNKTGEQNPQTISYDPESVKAAFEKFKNEDKAKVHLYNHLLKTFGEPTLRHLAALMNQSTMPAFIGNFQQMILNPMNEKFDKNFYVLGAPGFPAYCNIKTNLEEEKDVAKQVITVEVNLMFEVNPMKENEKPVFYFLYQLSATAPASEWQEDFSEKDKSQLLPNLKVTINTPQLRPNLEECHKDLTDVFPAFLN